MKAGDLLAWAHRHPRELAPGYVIPFPEPGRYPGVESACLVSREIPLQLLYSAYMQGAFPWFSEEDGEPVVWHSPNPRFCLRMEHLHVPRSIDRFLKHTPYTYTMDAAFRQVMEGCRDMARRGQNGSWIGSRMLEAYTAFFEAGYAHSVEAWHGERLAGGLYGVLIGSVFCGESMFTRESGSSKSAFVLFARAFAKCGGRLIDSQIYTDNIARYGAANISRDAFLRLESEYLHEPLAADLTRAFAAEAAGRNSA